VQIPDGLATVSGERFPECHWVMETREGGKIAVNHKSGDLPEQE